MLLAIALSGGVDSSVAALMLRQDWARMVGATHLIWPGSRCCSVEVLARAEQVCSRLGIPYFRVDLEREFREQVVGDFIGAYLAGRTPNPCIRCNRFVRFARFYTVLKERLATAGLLGEGEELAFATGHYARVRRTPDGWFLRKGLDHEKDQSYMLYHVRREMLPRLVFPLGELRKSEVLKKAREAELSYEAVKESQDACFVGRDYAEFIRAQTGRDELLEPGEITDPQGRVLGEHRGAVRYTVGQRSGLGLGSGPWYVARIDAAANRVVVARRRDAERSSFLIEDANWFIVPPDERLECGVKVRYRGGEIRCRVEPESSRAEGEAAPRFRVTLERPEIVTPGQSAVFYCDDLVLGGGVILT